MWQDHVAETLKRELAPAGERSGNIWFHGVEQAALTEREAACEIGFVLQNPENQTVTDKVWHETCVWVGKYGVPTRSFVVEWQRWHVFLELMTGSGKKPQNVSGGQETAAEPCSCHGHAAKIADIG